MGQRCCGEWRRSAVVIATGTLTSERFRGRILLEVFDCVLQVFEQESCKIAANAEPCQHPLHNQIAAVRRHGIGWHLPASDSQTVGQIIEGEARVFTAPHRPGASGHSATTVVDQFEYA
jgi:hypothetical protein